MRLLVRKMQASHCKVHHIPQEIEAPYTSDNTHYLRGIAISQAQLQTKSMYANFDGWAL
jgi:hypothetical protein